MKTKMLSAILALVMIISIIPTIAIAKNTDTKKYTVRLFMGDVNLDGKLNTGDATMILRHIAELVVLDEDQLARADANMDNEINTGDATYILRCLVGLNEPNYHDIEVLESFNVSYQSGLSEELAASVVLPETVLVEEEQTVTVAPALEIENEGFTFLGWMSSVDGTLYSAGDTFVMPACDVVLTATWESKTNITLVLYDSFNGLNISETATMSVVEGVNKITTENIVLPEGYVFADADFSATVTVTNGIATPSTVKVNVIPCQIIDDEIFLTVYTNTGFNNINNYLGDNFILANDIDLGNQNRRPFGWDWQNPLNDDTAFTGIFDGNGCTITGLYIDHTNNYQGQQVYDLYSNVGLFAINKGVIKNVNIYTRLYDGTSIAYGVFGDVNVGVVAGYNYGTISNCHVYGNAGSLDFIDKDRGACGGIAGTNGEDAVVERCSFEGGVEGFFWIGGLIGKNFGTLKESYFVGGINSAVDEDYIYDFSIRYVGGLCGGVQNGTIADCYTMLTNDIAADLAIGGIAGWISGGTYTNIYVVGIGDVAIVCTTDHVGGDVGYIASNPREVSGIVVSGTDSSVNNGTLPSAFSTEVWDMNGACYSKCPDLVKNRRGTSLFTEDE